jgi:uncharacterized protein
MALPLWVRALTVFAAALGTLLGGRAALAQRALPAVARVVDETGTLSPAQQAALAGKLAAFEQRKGSQIAVVLIPATEPETIEEFSIRLGESWKLGRKGVDDGAILVVAVRERRMRIEVGYGLEGALPDAVSKRIVADVMAPRFRQGDFYGGIEAAVDRMITAIDTETLPQATGRPGGAGREDTSAGAWVVGVFLAAVVLTRILNGFVPKARVASSVTFGGLAGGLIWFLFGSVLFAAGLGIAAALIGWAWSPHRGGFGLWHGGLGGGGFSGGGFGSGGGGDFGGGGGGFGGGGASGSW